MPRRPIALAMLTAGATLVALAPAEASSPQLSTVVSQTPVAWTPNVSASTTVGQTGVCNSQWFGTAKPCLSEVYGTAYVNGDVVAVGAFTEACQPAPLKDGLCASGTQVTRDDIVAYQAGTGKIDPNFVPILNQGPAFAVIPGPAGSNTVYVGGTFTSVNGATRKGLVQLNVNPGITTGSTADGSVVTSFKASVSNYVQVLALSPDGKALYAGGQFSSADSTAETGLARFNAATGAIDTSFKVTLTDPVTDKNGNPLPIKVEAMNQAANGTLLAFSGTAQMVNGQSRPRLAIINTGGTLGATATLTDFTAPILTNNCSAEHDYVRGISFAPDGSFLVIATTGFKNDGSMPFSVCDAVARFNTAGAVTTTGTAVNVSPAWINYSGGDSFFSVTDAGSVIYAGGHNRWVNNYCGTDFVCEQNALLDDGLSAFDANTGTGLAWWHPETLRGAGTMYINTFGPSSYRGQNTSGGLVLGTDVDLIGGAYHSENAIFPQGPVTTSLPFGPIPSGLFNSEGGSTTSHPMCLQDDTAHSNAVDLALCLYNGAQNWTAPAPGMAGHITINGLCLDTNGSQAVLDPCTTAATQQWLQGPGNTVVQQASGQCLDDPGSNPNPGTTLDIAGCVSGDVGQVFPLPVAPGPAGGSAALSSGSVFPQVVQSNTQVPCMDDKGGSLTAGTPVEVWTCFGNANQTWTVQPGGTIRHAGNCLDTSGGHAVLDPCNGSATQMWTPAGPSGNDELVQKSSGLCLTIPGDNTANGTQLDVEACAGHSYQAWRLPTI